MEVSMSSTKVFPARRNIPDYIRKLFSPPPILHYECADDYSELFSAIAVALEPSDMVDWVWVKDFTVLSWEVARLRRYRILLISTAERQPVKDILRPRLPDTSKGEW